MKKRNKIKIEKMDNCYCVTYTHDGGSKMTMCYEWTQALALTRKFLNIIENTPGKLPDKQSNKESKEPKFDGMYYLLKSNKYL